MADPTTVPDLRLWLKADSLATNTTNVSSWSNSAPGFTAESVAQSTAAKQPTYAASALNGLPAVSFDGVDDQLAVPEALLSLFRNLAGATIFVVARPDRPADTGTAVAPDGLVNWSTGGSSSSMRATLAWTQSNGASINESVRVGGRRLDGDSFDSSFTANDSWPRATWKIVTEALDWGNAAVRGYLNGKLSVEDLTFQTAGLTSDTASLRAFVGSVQGTSEFFLGPVVEILVYQRKLTDAERAEVHTYLSDRTKIAVSDYTFVLGGSLALAGAVRRRTQQTRTGGLALAGALRAMRLVVLRSALTPAGALARRTSGVRTGSSAVRGQLDRRVHKFRVGRVASAGLLRRSRLAVITGALAPSATTAVVGLGRVFGRAGVVALVVRAVGEVRLRVRRS